MRNYIFFSVFFLLSDLNPSSIPLDISLNILLYDIFEFNYEYESDSFQETLLIEQITG
jgi:hypothetical protein